MTVAAGMCVMWSISDISNAALVLNIDSVNEEFYFTGSDTGTTDAGWFSWSSAGWVSGSEPSVNISTAFALSGGNDVGYADIVFANSGLEISISPLGVIAPTALAVTGAGSGTKFSYASLDASLKNMFESQSSLPLEDGTGFSAISVQAIPEPATFLLFAMGCIGAWLVRRNARSEK
ncbi:MAG: PEP-CTERM sorting domain-containing protein [Kiritimatiellales bacterium]